MTSLLCTSRSYLVFFTLITCIPKLYSWSTLPRSHFRCPQTRHSRVALLAAKDDNRDASSSASSLRRISIAGASVSPTGFWMILQLSSDKYWPVQVTSSSEDTVAATSAESLTLLQLLANVDMAGPILPPELLAQLAIRHAESSSDDSMQSLLDQVQLSDIPYSELNEWQQARVKLPQVTLDNLVLTINGDDQTTSTWTLQCASSSVGRFEFTPTLAQDKTENDILTAFCCLALALRYQAPLLLLLSSTSSNADENISFSTLQELKTTFPLYKSLSELQQPAHRVQENLQRGFEIHKLTGALKIAMQRGDAQACEKIRSQLDKYDTMDDLPTFPQFETSDYDALQ